MSRRWRFATVAAAFLTAVGASLFWASRVPHGAALVPARLALRPGERAEVRLVGREHQVVALGFRLRFDEAVIEVEPGQESTSLLAADGSAVHLGIHRSPGLLEVPGVAVTGGRAVGPWDTLYVLTVRGVRPGSTTLTIDGLTVVDLAEESRTVPVSPCGVVVQSP